MRPYFSIPFMLVGIIVGPLAIMSFMPLGTATVLQPILQFGVVCFAAGGAAVALVLTGALMLHNPETQDAHTNQLPHRPPATSPPTALGSDAKRAS